MMMISSTPLQGTLFFAGFLVLCVASVLLSRDTADAVSIWVFVVTAVVALGVYAFWNIRKEAALEKDSTRVINENFFEDLTSDNQIQDSHVWMSGAFPKKLVYVVRDSELVKTLTSLSSLMERRVFVELVGRMEIFKRHYYDALRSVKESKKPMLLHALVADLQAVKKSIVNYMQSLVHQIPTDKQDKLFAIIDELSMLMKEAITRIKRMYAITMV